MSDLLLSVEPSLWAKVSGILFGVVFCAIVLWAYSPSMRRYFEDEANLPLDDQ